MLPAILVSGMISSLHFHRGSHWTEGQETAHTKTCSCSHDSVPTRPLGNNCNDSSMINVFAIAAIPDVEHCDDGCYLCRHLSTHNPVLLDDFDWNVTLAALKLEEGFQVETVQQFQSIYFGRGPPLFS